jgi:ubiquinone/menaquinone biosynthesis C-methylase UbiE
MRTELEKHIISEFSQESTQEVYLKKAEEGLWDSEKYFIDKYFTDTGASLLDIGCGTGRTTFPLTKSGYKVTGLDLVPAMIATAKKVADKLKQKIDFRVGDATELDIKDESFDYAIFSNQGWSQIPGKEKRLKAIREAFRVLKKGGIFIFTAHPRVFFRVFFKESTFFWIKQWIKIYILKPLGIKIMEQDYGDRFFDRGTIGSTIKFTKQYIHIPAVKEVIRQIHESGFTLIDANGEKQISKEDIRKHQPVFYICKK